MLIADNAGLREIFNGVWAISSLFMFGVLLYFILITKVNGRRSWRFRIKGWYRDYGVIAAGSIIILVFGHFIRSVTLWLFYVFRNAPFWSNWDWFFLILATVILLSGKLLCIYNFAPWAWRWKLLVLVIVITFAIPIIVYYWI